MRSIVILLLTVMMCGTQWATPLPPDSSLTASLITCWPGQEVYELYGHTALRIQGTDSDGSTFDSVWNYGVFNYSEPNFIGRFVKGEMRYKVAGYPFAWFMPEYIAGGRHVEEQVLNLTPTQAYTLRKNLQINALPQNATYLYDYVKDNCSTRVLDRIEESAGRMVLPDRRLYPTYREAMRAYHNHYPWYALGIDVALAYPVDTPINVRDQVFLPLMLHDMLAASQLPGGKAAVKTTEVLNPGLADATLAPTPWYATPLFWSILLLAAVSAWCIYALNRNRSLSWVAAIFFSIIGIAGCVVAFLVFFSIHKAAAPNLLLIWINPLALLVPTLIWSRATRPIAIAYLIAQLIALVLLAVIWPFQTQSGNPAMIPIALAEAILACSCICAYFRRNEKNI